MIIFEDVRQKEKYSSQAIVNELRPAEGDHVPSPLAAASD